MITFREERENGDVIEHKIASDEMLLSEILEQFEYFLKGCSYVFDGQVDIVNEQEDNESFYFDPSTANEDVNFVTDRGVEWEASEPIIFGDSDTITLDLTDTYGATTTTLKDD